MVVVVLLLLMLLLLLLMVVVVLGKQVGVLLGLLLLVLLLQTAGRQWVVAVRVLVVRAAVARFLFDPQAAQATTLAGVVRLDVLAQVVGSHETFTAHWTREALLARMGAQVTLQLIGSSEPLATEQPIAHEGAFAGVPAQMRLEMGRLPVHLTTSGYMATVDVLLLQMDTGRSESLRFLTIGTITRGPASVATLRPRGRGRRRRRGRGRRRGRRNGCGGRCLRGERKGWRHATRLTGHGQH